LIIDDLLRVTSAASVFLRARRLSRWRDATMLIFSLIGQCVWLAGALLWSVRRTVGAEDSVEGVIRGALLLYVLIVAGSFLFSVVIPGVLVAVGANNHVVVASFPEAICNVPVVLFGWGFALIVIVPARAMHSVIKHGW
jgi:hypothetical protein